MTERIVCFSHGKESGPWGTKIRALAAVAEECGWAVASVDYQGMDDAQARVDKLLDWCARAELPYLLAGSSMGGHVAAAAAERTEPIGLFLMAPAFFMPGYEQHTPGPPGCPVSIVHGWHDEIVPWRNGVRFGEACDATVTLLDDDHRLTVRLERVASVFRGFLGEVAGE